MSKSSIRKNISNQLLKKLSAEENTRVRKSLQRSGRPQVLFLEDLSFVNESIKELNKRHGERLGKLNTIRPTKSMLTYARSQAKVLQDKFISNNYFHTKGSQTIENTLAGRTIKERDPRTFKLILEGKAFVVPSFGSLSRLKRKIIEHVVEGTEDQLKKLKSSVDRGHGAGRGSPVSNLTIQQGLQQASTIADDPETALQIGQDLRSYLSTKVEEGELDVGALTEIDAVLLEYDSNVTKTKGVSANYIPYITYQNKYQNRGIDAAREKQTLKLVRQYFEEIGIQKLIDVEGSSSIRDKTFSVLVEPIVNVKIKDKKVKIDKKINPRKVKLKTEGFIKERTKKSSSKGGVKRRKKTLAASAPLQTRATQSSASLANILGVLNARLPDTVLSNMGPPGLENRTGRFAASVKATDVSLTKQGFPSVGYTYRKDPYQVYETTSGSRFSDSNRDPRPLIDKSIREIMAQYFLGRIYTRRQ